MALVISHKGLRCGNDPPRCKLLFYLTNKCSTQLLSLAEVSRLRPNTYILRFHIKKLFSQ